MSSNHIKRVAVVGAGGQVGTFITEALIRAGRFEVTALTRPNSSNTMPEGIHHIAKVDYNEKSSLVSALTHQDCLIITMSVFAGPQASQTLIEAAAEANVPWLLPNEWGGDHYDPSVAKESLVGEPLLANRKLITDLGKSSYIAFVSSFWYEYSLAAGPAFYGFDLDNKKATLIGDGNVKINTTTWPKVAAGVASLLSLPIHKTNPDTDTDTNTKNPTCLDDFKNKCCYAFSFRLTQREMFDSLLRVTGDKEADWTVTYEDAKQRYADGMKELQSGNRMGFGKCLYTRYFFPGGPGDYQSMGKDHTRLLGLEDEDLDARTELAVARWRERGHMNLNG